MPTSRVMCSPDIPDGSKDWQEINPKITNEKLANTSQWTNKGRNPEQAIIGIKIIPFQQIPWI